MKRIGILGGTFNPIHLGHLMMAEMAREKLKLDKVIFVPSCLPPHKSEVGVLPAQDRYKMVRLATQGNSAFSVSDFEIKKGGKSYSIETVTHFKNHFAKGTKFYFIIGQDSLATLHLWKRIDDLLKIVSFVVMNRPDASRHSSKNSKNRDTYLLKRYVSLFSMPGVDISSSYIRQAFATGKSVKYLLPEKVIRYIEKRQLYR